MTSHVSGVPRLLLRAEGCAVLLVAVLAYRHIDGGWGLFALLFLAPDLALLGYLGGPRLGAMIYNAGHTYIGPVLLAGLGHLGLGPGVTPFCLIWVAHIGLDRTLGLGLKYGTAFRETHLGFVGRVRAASAAEGP
jgi:hypothetical protein